MLCLLSALASDVANVDICVYFSHFLSFLADATAQVCKSGETSHGDADTEVCTEEEERTSGSLMGQLSSIVVGQILAGIGAAPIMPLAVTYMDDSLDRSSTSIYVGESCFQDSSMNMI